jgi:hypothetical protein
MADITLSLDEETIRRMRAAAEVAGLSLSAWLARVVGTPVHREWPPEVLALAGAWREFPTADELRANQPPDTTRVAW